jgi:hypothetical protein
MQSGSQFLGTYSMPGTQLAALHTCLICLCQEHYKVGIVSQNLQMRIMMLKD